MKTTKVFQNAVQSYVKDCPRIGILISAKPHAYRGSLYLRESLTCMGGSTVHKTVILEVRFNKVVMQIFCI